MGGIRVGDIDGGFRDAGDLAGFWRDARIGQCLGHVLIRCRIADDFEFAGVAFHVVGTRFEGDFHEFFLIGTFGGNEEQALAFEHPSHATVFTQISAMLG